MSIEVDVVHGVVPGHVALADNPLEYVGVLNDIRANREERCRNVFAGQDVEHLWSEFRIGSVVEGQHDLSIWRPTEMIDGIWVFADLSGLDAICDSVKLVGEGIDQMQLWCSARFRGVRQAVDPHDAAEYVLVLVTEDGQFLQIQIRKHAARIPAVTVRRNMPYRIKRQRRHSDRQDGNDHRDDTNTDDEVVQALTRSVEEHGPRHVVQHRLITSDEAVSSRIGGYGAMTRRCLQPWAHDYSTVTDLARLRGLSTSRPKATASVRAKICSGTALAIGPHGMRGPHVTGTVLPAPPMLTIRPPRA